MYKHIVRDKRHSYFNQMGAEGATLTYNLESIGDISEAGSHRFKNLDSCLSKSRAGGNQTIHFSG